MIKSKISNELSLPDIRDKNYGRGLIVFKFFFTVQMLIISIKQVVGASKCVYSCSSESKTIAVEYLRCAVKTFTNISSWIVY